MVRPYHDSEGLRFWRRGGDSNPRHPFGVKLLSRQPCSATPAPLRGQPKPREGRPAQKYSTLPAARPSVPEIRLVSFAPPVANSSESGRRYFWPGTETLMQEKRSAKHSRILAEVGGQLQTEATAAGDWPGNGATRAF